MLQIPSNTMENKRFAIANTVEVAASSSKMLQIARKTNRRGNTRKSKRTITLLVIPTVTKFCHSFRHLIWKYIWHIFSDIRTFYSGTLSGIYSILTFSLIVALPDLDLAVEVQQCPLRSGAREEGGEKEEGGRKEEGSNSDKVQRPSPGLGENQNGKNTSNNSGPLYLSIC